jgi:hypothetical protein
LKALGYFFIAELTDTKILILWQKQQFYNEEKQYKKLELF